MKIGFLFPKGFPALAEGFAALGATLVDSVAAIDEAELAACLIDFHAAARAPWSTWRLKRRLARRGIPLIGIDRDAPWHKGVRRRRLWLLDRLGALDVYATHARQGRYAFAPTLLYLPNAAWTRHYHLAGRTLADLRRPEGYCYDVSFLGNLDAARYPEHRARVALLAELEARLRAHGVCCLFRDSQGLSAAEQVAVIQASRINLNVGAACDAGGERSWGLAERCYGVPACGGFLLSDERRHAAEDFVPGVEWADFSDGADCVRRILHYLAHPEAARAIAEAAHARTLRDHTYACRARTLIAAAEEWRARRPAGRRAGTDS